MAQATITGSLAVGFAGDTAATGVKTSGYGIDTASIVISATEDLGGGLKVFGSMGLEGFLEDHNTNGNGASLGLSGGFGSIVMSATESSDFLPVDGLNVNSNGTDADRVTYTSPKMSGFTFQLIHQDAIDAGAALGAEMDADARGTDSALTFAVNYATGPLSLDVVSADFRNHASISSRTGFRASYDFGVAKVTYGQLEQDNITAADVTETGLTIAAPLGPVSVAYAMATSKAVDAAKRKGNSLSVSYALSKRSSIALYQESHDSAAGSASKTKENSVLLKHSF